MLYIGTHKEDIISYASVTVRHQCLSLASNKKERKRKIDNQRTNGPVNAHLISWPSKAQNMQNLENIW